MPGVVIMLWLPHSHLHAHWLLQLSCLVGNVPMFQLWLGRVLSSGLTVAAAMLGWLELEECPRDDLRGSSRVGSGSAAPPLQWRLKTFTTPLPSPDLPSPNSCASLGQL